MERLLELKNRWNGGIHFFNKEECKEIIDLSEKVLIPRPDEILIGYSLKFKKF